MRRVHSRGQDNIAKRLLIHAAAFNLSLILRRVLGVGTARQAADRLAALCFCFWRLVHAAHRGIDRCTVKTWFYPRAATRASGPATGLTASEKTTNGLDLHQPGKVAPS